MSREVNKPFGAIISIVLILYFLHSLLKFLCVAQLCYSRILNLGSVTPGGHRWTPAEIVNKIYDQGHLSMR